MRLSRQVVAVPVCLAAMAGVLPASAAIQTSAIAAPAVAVPPAQIPGTAAAHTPSEVLAYVIAFADEGIALAEQARRRPVGQKIRALVALMLTDLRQQQVVTRALAGQAGIMPIDTTDISDHRKTSRVALEELAGAEGDAYGSDFLQALVEHNTGVLDLMDKRLVPDASGDDAVDEAVLAHLREARTHFAAHLLRAQELASAGE